MALKDGETRMHPRMLSNLHGHETLVELGSFFLAQHCLAVFQELVGHLLMHLEEIDALRILWLARRGNTGSNSSP